MTCLGKSLDARCLNCNTELFGVQRALLADKRKRELKAIRKDAVEKPKLSPPKPLNNEVEKNPYPSIRNLKIAFALRDFINHQKDSKSEQFLID